MKFSPGQVNRDHGANAYPQSFGYTDSNLDVMDDPLNPNDTVFQDMLATFSGSAPYAPPVQLPHWAETRVPPAPQNKPCAQEQPGYDNTMNLWSDVPVNFNLDEWTSYIAHGQNGTWSDTSLIGFVP